MYFKQTCINCLKITNAYENLSYGKFYITYNPIMTVFCILSYLPIVPEITILIMVHGDAKYFIIIAVSLISCHKIKR